jgi:hypothetical protein
MVTIAENINILSATLVNVKSIDAIENSKSELVDSNNSSVNNAITDKIIISDEYYNKTQVKNKVSSTSTQSDDATQSNKSKSSDKSEAIKETTSKAKKEIKEEKVIEKYKHQEQNVIAHETAHKMAGGELVRGGTTYQYSTAPDGKKYISGGEVKIDMSEIPGDPRATISKMQQVENAALAPSDPSSQDRAVAAEASTKEGAAIVDLMKEKTSKLTSIPNSSVVFEVYKKQTTNEQIDSSQSVSSLDNKKGLV